jgi:hypothetical protein
MLTEAIWAAQGVVPVVGVVLVAGAICVLVDKLMHSEARMPLPTLSGLPLPTIAIQPDGSVYVRGGRERLGGATKAPRLRAGKAVR